MQIHDLKRNTPQKKSKRVGRGGKRGKTSGRGMKGQNARSGNKKRPEMRDIISKIPKLRGRGVNINTPVSAKPFPINLSQIEKAYESGEKVTPSTLVAKGVLSIAKGKKPAVKILGTGEISKKITVADCAFSESAKTKIEKAGGKVLG
jgi:large subunit ribosomal protein L15